MFKGFAALLVGMTAKGLIDKPLQNGPDAFDQLSLLLFGYLVPGQVVTVFFNIEWHGQPYKRCKSRSGQERIAIMVLAASRLVAGKQSWVNLMFTSEGSSSVSSLKRSVSVRRSQQVYLFPEYNL